MKPTREEIGKLIDEHIPSFGEVEGKDIYTFFLAAYKMGQEEMRERAAQKFSQLWVLANSVEEMVAAIRSLPLEGEE